MTIREIYELAVQKGKENDPRGIEAVEQELERLRRDYEELKPAEKEVFDLERLRNPYADTRVLYGDLDTNVERAMVGIDIEVGEILLADRLREKQPSIGHCPSSRRRGPGQLAPGHAHAGRDLGQLCVPINIGRG